MRASDRPTELCKFCSHSHAFGRSFRQTVVRKERKTVCLCLSIRRAREAFFLLSFLLLHSLAKITLWVAGTTNRPAIPHTSCSLDVARESSCFYSFFGTGNTESVWYCVRQYVHTLISCFAVTTATTLRSAGPCRTGGDTSPPGLAIRP